MPVEGGGERAKDLYQFPRSVLREADLRIFFFLRRSTAGVVKIRQEIAAAAVDLRLKLADVTNDRPMTVSSQTANRRSTAGRPQVESELKPL